MRFLRALPIAASVLFTACDSSNSSNRSGADLATRAEQRGEAKSEARTLELVFSDSTYQLTGVAKAPNNGPLLIQYPKWSDVYQYAIVQAEGLTGRRPFPNEAMNTGAPSKNTWVCVQSATYTDAGDLYVLDPAAPRLKKITGGGPKLVAFVEGMPMRTYSLQAPGMSDSAYVNDVSIDARRGIAYMTESKDGGIVILNLGTGAVRYVLNGHYSVKSDPAYKFIIGGRELMKDGKPAKFNSDGIALSPDGDWLYYKPLTDDKLYRVKTADLLDSTLAAAELGNRVEDMGHFTTTDGMICDAAGNLYLGDIQESRIMRVDPSTKKMTELVRDARLSWPDSYAIADGYLYITCSRIHEQPEYNAGINKRTGAYTLYRMKL